MLRFTLANPVVAGGKEFVITTAADAQNRSCDTTIEVTGPEPFTERHRQYFHDGDEVRTALDDAGVSAGGGLRWALGPVGRRRDPERGVGQPARLSFRQASHH